MKIKYVVKDKISNSEFIDILKRSGLSERRPIDDLETMNKMVNNANLIITARNEDDLIIGIARSITDFAYCCYLSCLAVDEKFKRNGIGKELIRQTLLQISDKASLLLLSAPGTEPYYKQVGFDMCQNAYIIRRGEHYKKIMKLNTDK